MWTPKRCIVIYVFHMFKNLIQQGERASYNDAFISAVKQKSLCAWKIVGGKRQQSHNGFVRLLFQIQVGALPVSLSQAKQQWRDLGSWLRRGWSTFLNGTSFFLLQISLHEKLMVPLLSNVVTDILLTEFLFRSEADYICVIAYQYIANGTYFNLFDQFCFRTF